jgi:hypothetical protein
MMLILILLKYVKTVKLLKKIISDTQAAWKVHIPKKKKKTVLLAGTINQSDKTLGALVINLSQVST